MTDYLDRLRGIGAPEELVERERDAWILMAARWPAELPALMADKVAQLENPKVVRLYRLVGRFLDDWEDDRLLHETADLIHELLEEAAATGQLELQGEDDPAFIGLVDSFADQAHPAVARLRGLVNQRGWTGWTQVGKREPSRRPAARAGSRCGRSRGPTWRPRRGSGRRACASGWRGGP